MEQIDSLIDVRDLLWKARQYRNLIILPIVVALCGAVLLYKFTPPLYESYATVSVGDRPQVSPALEPLVRADRDQGTPVRDRIALLDSRIHGRAFLQTLVDRIGLLRSPAIEKLTHGGDSRWAGISPEEYQLRTAVSLLGRKISAVPAAASFVRIVARDTNPVQAKIIASAAADLLMEQSRESSLERAQARGTFSSDQIAIYQGRLRKSEDALRDYQESLIGRNLQASLINDGNLDIARNLIRLNDEEIEQIRNRLAAERNVWLQEASDGSEVPDLTSPAVANMGGRLEEIEMSYGIAALGGEKATGDVAALKSKIADLRQGLLTEFENLAANVLPSMSERGRTAAAGIALDRTILRSLRAKGQRLNGQVASFAQGIRNSPRDQMELERLRGDVETNRQLVTNLQKEATSSRLSEALETSELGVRLDIVEPAQVPIYPVWPNALRIFGGALLVGPFAGLALILAIEKLAAVIRTVEQAEHELGVRVIGTVPRVEGWSRPGSFLRNHWAGLAIVLVLLLTGSAVLVQSAFRTERTPSRPSAVERR